MEDYSSRAVELGRYISENRATVRSAAKRFGISKSTVHTDVTSRLRLADTKSGAVSAQIRCMASFNMGYSLPNISACRA